MESVMQEDVTIATPVAARSDYKQITLVCRKTKGDPNRNHPNRVNPRRQLKRHRTKHRQNVQRLLPGL